MKNRRNHKKAVYRYLNSCKSNITKKRGKKARIFKKPPRPLTVTDMFVLVDIHKQIFASFREAYFRPFNDNGEEDKLHAYTVQVEWEEEIDEHFKNQDQLANK